MLSHFYNLYSIIQQLKSIESAENETSLGGTIMPKPRTKTGEKNLISRQLIELRRQHNYSQRYLSYLLQLAGYDQCHLLKEIFPFCLSEKS